MHLTNDQLELLILAGYSDSLIERFVHENTKPADLYGAVAEVVTQALIGDASLISMIEAAAPNSALYNMKKVIEGVTGSDELTTAAKWWADMGITRSDTKAIVMTYLYGSTEYGNRDSILERIEERAKETLSKNLDAYHDRSGSDVWKEERTHAVTLMVKQIRAAMGVNCASTVETMDTLQSWAESCGNLDKPFKWVSPILGFPVEQANRNMVTKPVRIYENGREVMKLLYRTPSPDGKRYNTKKMKAGVAPDVIHTNDATHLMLSTIYTDSSYFMHIHDSMSTQCADTPDLAHNIRKSFCDMYAEDADYLYDLYELNGGHSSFMEEPKELGEFDVTLVMRSRYFFS